jgi:hypothetical protein
MLIPTKSLLFSAELVRQSGWHMRKEDSPVSLFSLEFTEMAKTLKDWKYEGIEKEPRV